MIRYKCVVAYNGAAYDGWQTQKNGRSIQEQIEPIIQKITCVPTTITASGRTDAGVSARAQVFHFDAEKDMTGRKWMGAMNAFLPKDIHIMSVEQVSPRFHARHCVRWKRYTYRVNDGPYDVFTKDTAYQCPQPLNFEKMQEAAGYLVGKHDFTAYNSSTLAEYPDQVRTVEKIELVRHGHMIEMTFQAKGFLRYMVRMMSAQLIEVGKGKLEPEDVKKILDTKSKETSKRNAPACGLTLEQVDYYDVMAMSEEALLREYILKDDIPAQWELPDLEKHIRERVFPMIYVLTTRYDNRIMGYAQMVEDGIQVHVNEQSDLVKALSLEEDMRLWLMENGFDRELSITFHVDRAKM